MGKRHYLEGGQPQRRFYAFDPNHPTLRADDDPATRAEGDGLEVHDRSIPGTAIVYGDIAELPWGENETMDPGVFGNLSRADVILNFQHDRTKPLTRSDGGGLRLIDNPSELRIEPEMPETQMGDDALTLVRDRTLRGYSVEFVPEEWKQEERGNTVCTVITSAKLINIGLVDRPAYPKSRVEPRSEDASMDEQEIRELIESLLAERSEGDGGQAAQLNVDGLATALAEGLGEMVRSEVAQALEAAAEAERAAERKKKEMEEKEEDMDKMADDRAELLVSLKPLLPDGFETRGQSNHDLLVAAAGDEIADAAEQSEDYLRAKIEGILERRAAAEEATTTTTATRSQPTPPAVTASGAVNMLTVRRPAMADS